MLDISIYILKYLVITSYALQILVLSKKYELPDKIPEKKTRSVLKLKIKTHILWNVIFISSVHTVSFPNKMSTNGIAAIIGSLKN